MIEWYSVGHHGINPMKGELLVEFKEFFSMMKNWISDGADVLYFFKDLVAMITDVTEDERGTSKDPSTKLSKESTLRSYAKEVRLWALPTFLSDTQMKKAVHNTCTLSSGPAALPAISADINTGYALGSCPGRYQCARCRHQVPLTANTVMHRTHLPLPKWLWVIYLETCDKRGISALTLTGKIPVSYETAWHILHRICKAMEKRDAQYTLGRIIEFGDSYFGAKVNGKEGCGAGSQDVFFAVGKDEVGQPKYLKMQSKPNIQISFVQKFVDENLETSSVVETGDFRSFRKSLQIITCIRLKISPLTVGIWSESTGSSTIQRHSSMALIWNQWQTPANVSEWILLSL